jgi:hypothetical protein
MENRRSGNSRHIRLLREIAKYGSVVPRDQVFKVMKDQGITNKHAVSAYIKNWIAAGHMRRVGRGKETRYEIVKSPTVSSPTQKADPEKALQSLSSLRKLAEAASVIVQEGANVPADALNAILGSIVAPGLSTRTDVMDTVTRMLDEVSSTLREISSGLPSLRHDVQQVATASKILQQLAGQTVQNGGRYLTQLEEAVRALKSIQGPLSRVVETLNRVASKVDRFEIRPPVHTYSSFSEFAREYLAHSGVVRHVVGVCALGILEIVLKPGGFEMGRPEDAYMGGRTVPSECVYRLLPIAQPNGQWIVNPTSPISHGNVSELDSIVEDAALVTFYTDRKSVWVEPVLILRTTHSARQEEHE